MSKNRKGVCLVIVGGIFWGCSGVMGKYLFNERDITAAWLVATRLVGAGALMVLLSWLTKKNEIFAVWKEKKSAASQVIFGLFGMMLCQLTYFETIQASNPGTATVLQSTAPILILLYTIVRQKRKPLLFEVAVLITVSLGVYLLATHGNIHSLAITKQTLLWGGAAAITLSIYNLQPTQLIAKYGAPQTVGWAMLIGGIVMIPITRYWNIPGIWDWKTVALLLGVVIFGTLVPFTLYMQGVVYLGPVRASMFGCIEPLVATILSAVILGTAFGVIDIAGIVCILGGATALAMLGKKESE